MAEQAGAGLQTTSGEVAAARWLDAEDATMCQVLAWAMAHDPLAALQMTTALAPWWQLRGRLAAQYSVLREAAGHGPPGSDRWCAAQNWLGFTAFSVRRDLPEALGHLTAVQDAIGDKGPSRALADCLAWRALVLGHLGRIGEAADTGRRAVAMARELSDPAGEALALINGALLALNAGDFDDGLRVTRQAEQITADIPGWITRNVGNILTAALTAVGDLAAAEPRCTAGLARSREVGDLGTLVRLLIRMAALDWRADRTKDAAQHLREALQIAVQAGFQTALVAALDTTADLCAASGRYPEAVTLWASVEAADRYAGYAETSDAARLDERIADARRALRPTHARAAQHRGAAMTLDTAVESALMLTAPEPSPAAALSPGTLSTRERELVTLVAQGRTNAQIAAQLHISVCTVSSHLDRIRDKTGCRRRADLTRLALTTGLV